MSKFWEKYKEYLIIVLYLIVLWALFNFVVMPGIKRINESANKIQEKIAEKEGSSRKMEKVSTMKEQYEVIGKEEAKIQDLLSYDQAIILIEAVEKLAAETGNKADIKVEERANASASAKSKTTKKKDAAVEEEIMANLPTDKYLKMNITLTGDLEGIIDFIRRLENIRYWSDTVSLQMSSEKIEETTTRQNPMDPGEEEKKEEPAKKYQISTTLQVVFYLSN